jgi:UPF0716 family protein affecting phage T7 exclusion
MMAMVLLVIASVVTAFALVGVPPTVALAGLGTVLGILLLAMMPRREPVRVAARKRR